MYSEGSEVAVSRPFCMVSDYEKRLSKHCQQPETLNLKN